MLRWSVDHLRKNGLPTKRDELAAEACGQEDAFEARRLDAEARRRR